MGPITRNPETLAEPMPLVRQPLVAGQYYTGADFLAALRPVTQAKPFADAPGKGA
jgi:hypothetical protein